MSVHPGIPALLANLTADGHELRVVSSKPQCYSEPVLPAAGLTRYFTGIYGPSRTETEPKRVTLARALRESAATTATYMVGDTEADIVAARANQATSVAVTWGYATLERLQNADPDHLATTPDHVAHIINRTRQHD